MARQEEAKCPSCSTKIPAHIIWSATRDRADKMFGWTNKHPKLKEANSLLAKCRKLEAAVREEQAVARRKLKAKYKRDVTVKVSVGDSWTKIPEGDEYLVIDSELLNGKEFDEHLHYYGSLTQPPDRKQRSVRYYRKHGLLLHDGGGYHFLEDEQPCSDQEWEQFKSNKIPEKFLR